MPKFWLKRAYVSACLLIAVAIGSYAATIPSAPVLDSVTSIFNDTGWEYTLHWNASAGASSYALQTSTDYYFSTTTFSQTGITGTSFTLLNTAKDTTIKLNSNSYAYWRLNAANDNGVSGWSNVDSIVGLVLCGYGGPISGPSLNSAATNVQLPVTFSWRGPETFGCPLYEPGSSFILEIAIDTGFSLVIDTGSINGGPISGGSGFESWFSYSYSPNNLKNSTTYYWRIRFVGGPWFDTSKFTTGGTSVRLSIDGKLSKTDFTVSNKMISYSLATPSPVEITFSDVLGRTALVVNRKQSVGRYTMELKNCNLASGHYIVSFKAVGVEKQASVVITR
jgi:hypothetical protein